MTDSAPNSSFFVQTTPTGTAQSAAAVGSAPAQSLSPSSALLGRMKSAFTSGQSPVIASNPVTSPPSQVPEEIGAENNLDVLDSVLREVEQPPAAMIPPVPTIPPAQTSPPVPTTPPVSVATAVQALATLPPTPPPYPQTATFKEKPATSLPDQAGIEAVAGMQYVEQERPPELPVEVEGYLQHVEDNAATQPQEIVLADIAAAPLPTHVPKQSVVVLPITPDAEVLGAKKGPLSSLRWLVEWSRKLMKMFAGKIVYRQVEST